MKSRGKSLVVIIVALTFVCNSSITYAKINSSEINKKINEVVDIVNENYYFIDDVDTEALRDAALWGMFYALDNYSEYYTKDDFNAFISEMENEKVGLGIYINFLKDGNIVIDKVLEGSPAEKAGLKDLDVILKINGKEISKLTYIEANKLLSGKEGAKVKLTVKRDNKYIDIEVTFKAYNQQSVFISKMENVLPENKDNSVRYIKIEGFYDETLYEFEKVYAQCIKENVKSVIIDLRDNYGGYINVCLGMLDKLANEGNILQIVDSQGKVDYLKGGQKKVPFKIILLVNRNTASASELLAAAIQESKSGTIIGEASFGKGLMQELRPLNKGDGMKLTTHEFLTGKGKKINGTGVKLDVEILTPWYFSSYAQIDSKSYASDIKDLNRVLSFLGYDVKADSDVYNDSTKKAIIDIQKNSAINQTGICDSDTIIVLNKKLKASLKTNDPLIKEAYKIITK